MEELSQDFTQSLYDNFAANDKYRVAENAITKNGLYNALESHASHANNIPEFSIDLTKDKVTDQMQSGRCWMFASLNTLRHKVIKQYNLENFEISQAYTFFWDKYEKSNWFFEQLIKNPDMDDRKLKFLLNEPQGDGGQWDMIVAIIEKYGLVPKAIYPESVSSSRSGIFDRYLNKLLRQDAQLLLEVAKAGEDVEELRAQLLQEIFNYLAANLGLPPQKFDFAFRDKDGKNFERFSGTPQEFYKNFVDVDLKNYVSIINAPTADKEFGKSYTVEFLGNVVGAKAVKHLNLDIDRFKELAISQMQQGEVVWFGCDVSQLSNEKDGLLTLDAFDFDRALDIKFTQDKASRLDYSESLMTHAMVLAGVDLDENGKSTKWKVENSWGDKIGSKGYFVASDAWMDEFTYQVVIRKDLLTAEEQAAYDAEPEVLLPWDPMGALA